MTRTRPLVVRMGAGGARRLALAAACVALLALASAGAAAVQGTEAAGAAPARGTAVGKLLAPPTACPHQAEPTAKAVVQERAMRCLTNYARSHAGLTPLAGSKPLTKAANRKAADILRCDEFSHAACGRAFTFWPKHFGYVTGSCWSAAENIAWGTGPIGSARAIFRAWLGSPGHRENILGSYADLGVGLRQGALEGHAGAHVWVQEFGSHAC